MKTPQRVGGGGYTCVWQPHSYKNSGSFETKGLLLLKGATLINQRKELHLGPISTEDRPCHGIE